MDSFPAIEMQNITKSFDGFLANDGVNFSVNKGEIHALVGENGAGKSTLMKVLYGMYHPDSGTIAVHGTKVAIDSPSLIGVERTDQGHHPVVRKTKNPSGRCNWH